MDINQLSEIVKKKILENQSVEEIYLEDKSFYIKIIKIMILKNFI